MQSTSKTSKILERVSKLSIYLLVFLLPLFFLPWTANVLDFNKQALLIFLVFLSFLSWLLRSIIEGKISLNFSLFNLPVILFLVILGIVTAFSSYQYGSFWGLPLDIASSFLTIFGFLLLYFLISNIFQERKEIFGLFLTLISSGFLVALFGISQIFGKFIFPLDFAKFTSFNTIGTVNSLGIFLAALLPLVLVLTFITRRIIKFLLFAFGLAILFLLFIVNFWVAWVSLLIGSIVLLIFGIIQRQISNISWIILPMVLLVISLLFGIFRIPITGLPAVPLEVSPSFSATFNIAVQTLKDHDPSATIFKSLLLGSGPGTFSYDYSKFKSEALNQTVFWAVRFSSGASDILDKLITTGILGLISFLGILGAFCWVGFKAVLLTIPPAESKTSGGSDFRGILSLGIFASWFSIVIGQFLYPANLSLSFLFWVFTASLIALNTDRVKTWDLRPSSLSTIGVTFIFIFVLILGASLSFLSGQRYLAEIRYLQGLEAVQKGDNQMALDYLLRAISQSGGKQDNYWRDLSQTYLFRINEELQRKDVSQEEIAGIISPFLANAIGSAKAATDVAPKNVANWAVRGFVYRNLINLIKGTDEWAIKAYQEAISLEPANPYLYTELGRVYLAKDDLEAAREQFQKALTLKSDYAPAHFQIAMIFVREGKTAEAIDKLEATKTVAPFDPGLALQLGVIYYQENQFDKAKGEFERAVSLDPNYSNARYFLGLIYARQNQKDKAIEQFEKIAELNPDNEEVKKILANLRVGKPALEGITPAQPPIEEVPPERLEKK